MAAFERCILPFGEGARATRGRSKVLRLLFLSETGRMAQHEIGKSLGVSSPNITYLVDGLERDGLVERTGRADDRRITMIGLTERGLDTASRLVPAVAEFMATTCQDMNDSEKAVLIDLLSRMRRRSEVTNTDEKEEAL